MKKVIKPMEREAIIRSLRSGIVPKIGLQHIQVGRAKELDSFIKDITNIVDGGNSFRLVIGEYGSGKTFFLSLVRSIALEKGLVTLNADLSPNKRICGSQDQPKKLVSELIANISTRTKQDGNALSYILERVISLANKEAQTNKDDVASEIYKMLKELEDYYGGESFIKVIAYYWYAYNNNDDDLKSKCIKWLRCEYKSRTDAKKDLNVREILADYTFFNIMELYSVLVRKSGYKGLLICLDEMVNLYKITNTQSRKSNYEEILNILNNTYQGTISNIGFIMSGTPDFLTDEARGLYSYEALRSRLAENNFAKKIGITDYNSTVLRLANLHQEELLLLLKNIRNVYAYGKKDSYLVPDEAIIAYMKHCNSVIGDSYFRTPRNTIKGFIDLLSVLEQSPQSKWENLVEETEVTEDIESDNLSYLMTNEKSDSNLNEEFASFNI